MGRYGFTLIEHPVFEVELSANDCERLVEELVHDHGCRVLALMGGEPLIRPEFLSPRGVALRAPARDATDS
jgi:molybdenum cofactor biosynthesis enzyme MoaA